MLLRVIALSEGRSNPRSHGRSPVERFSMSFRASSLLPSAPKPPVCTSTNSPSARTKSTTNPPTGTSRRSPCSASSAFTSACSGPSRSTPMLATTLQATSRSLLLPPVCERLSSNPPIGVAGRCDPGAMADAVGRPGRSAAWSAPTVRSALRRMRPGDARWQRCSRRAAEASARRRCGGRAAVRRRWGARGWRSGR
jgi:hypothetical protein